MELQTNIELIKSDAPLSKDLIVRSAKELLERVEAGDIDPLRLRTVIAMYEKAFDQIKKVVTEKALDEFDKYSEKALMKGDCQIERMEAGVSYDYSNDSVWNEIKATENFWAEKRKAREKFLRAVPADGMNEVDEVSGEVMKIYPPLKKSTTTLKFSFK